jgi:hypothetical protein
MIIGILGFDFFIYLLAKLSDADTLTFFTDIKFFYNMDVIYSFALILLCVALYSFLYLFLSPRENTIPRTKIKKANIHNALDLNIAIDGKNIIMLTPISIVESFALDLIESSSSILS